MPDRRRGRTDATDTATTDAASDDDAAPATRSGDGRPRHLKPRPDRHRLRLVRRVVAVKAVATTTAVAIGITAAAAATGVVVTVVDPPKWPLSADKDETTTSSTFEMPTVTLDLGRPAIPGSKPTAPRYSPTLQIACVLDFVCPDPVAVLGQKQVDAIRATTAAKTAPARDVSGPASSSAGDGDPSSTDTTASTTAPQDPGTQVTTTTAPPEPEPETTTTTAAPEPTTTTAPPDPTTTTRTDDDVDGDSADVRDAGRHVLGHVERLPARGLSPTSSVRRGPAHAPKENPRRV